MVFTIASYDFRTFDARKSYLMSLRRSKSSSLQQAWISSIAFRDFGLNGSKCIAGCVVADRYTPTVRMKVVLMRPRLAV